MRVPVLAIVVVALVAHPLPVRSQKPPTVDEVMRWVGLYLETYEPQLSTVVADERLVQRGGDPFAREINSEVAFVALPDDAGWLGIRDVLRVGGRRVRTESGSLSDAMRSGVANGYELARKLLLDGAKYNLGEARTINLPNLPLEFLHPRNWWRFDARLDGRERVRGHQTWRLIFEEGATPTLIQRAQGGDIKSTVVGWVEPESGRLWRAEVRSRDARLGAARFESNILVEFAEHEAMGFLVPLEMHERFFVRRDVPGTGRATYSNFRRFTTGARVIPQ